MERLALDEPGEPPAATPGPAPGARRGRVTSLAGGLAGAAVGALDAAAAGPWGVAAGLGLGAGLGLAAGILWGVSAEGAPIGLGPRLRGLGRILWPRPDGGLAERSRAVATAWIGAAALAWGLPLVTRLAAWILGRLQSALFAGLGVALVSLAVVLGVGAVAVSLRGILARSLEALARRWPRLGGPLSHPLPHALAALGWLGFQGAAFGAAASAEGARTAAFVGLGLGIGAGLALALVGPLARRPRGLGLALVLGVGLGGALGWGGWRQPGVRAALAAGVGWTALWARAVTPAGIDVAEEESP